MSAVLYLLAYFMLAVGAGLSVFFFVLWRVDRRIEGRDWFGGWDR